MFILRQTLQRGGAFLAICAFGFLSPNEAEAYKTHGRYSKDRIPVGYRVNPAGMPYGTGPVHRAAQNWSNKSRIHFAFKYEGASTAGRTSAFNNVAMSSRINRGALAMTWWTNRGGYLSGFDIGMNNRTRTSQRRWSNTILHEFGHALGMLHTRNSNAVMESGSGSGNNLLDLHEDDIRGAATLYPPRGRHPGLGATPTETTPTRGDSPTGPVASGSPSAPGCVGGSCPAPGATADPACVDGECPAPTDPACVDGECPAPAGPACVDGECPAPATPEAPRDDTPAIASDTPREPACVDGECPAPTTPEAPRDDTPAVASNTPRQPACVDGECPAPATPAIDDADDDGLEGDGPILTERTPRGTNGRTCPPNGRTGRTARPSDNNRRGGRLFSRWRRVRSRGLLGAIRR